MAPSPVMARESAATKAVRYLSEGRLIVTEVSKRRVRAYCRGGGALYSVSWDARGWRCDCPALTECAHLKALKMVVAPVHVG